MNIPDFLVWHCVGCGKPAEGIVKPCDCVTMVGVRDGPNGSREQTWFISALTRPTGRDADEWNVFLSEHSQEFASVQIAEALDEAYTAGALAMKEAAAKECDRLIQSLSLQGVYMDASDHLMTAGVRMTQAAIRALPVPPRGSKI